MNYLCLKCMKQIYEDEKTCPNCGAKNPDYDSELIEYEQMMDEQRERLSNRTGRSAS